MFKLLLSVIMLMICDYIIDKTRLDAGFESVVSALWRQNICPNSRQWSKPARSHWIPQWHSHGFFYAVSYLAVANKCHLWPLLIKPMTPITFTYITIRWAEMPCLYMLWQNIKIVLVQQHLSIAYSWSVTSVILRSHCMFGQTADLSPALQI